MRLITLIFVALVVLIQYPLWLGHGGWLHVHEDSNRLQVQLDTNAQLKARNEKLAAEVRDLRGAAGAVEERARSELGMIKEGEIFVQVLDHQKSAPATPTAAVPQNPAPSTPAH